jgi:hypothetical protein
MCDERIIDLLNVVRWYPGTRVLYCTRYPYHCAGTVLYCRE